MSGKPSPKIYENPFELETDGIVIRGFCCMAESEQNAPVLIILHGIPRAVPAPGDHSYRDMAMRFAGEGFLSVVFNFRGTGISEGDLGMAGWSRDLRAVIDFALEFPLAGPGLALLGFSAGGAIAIYTAAHDPRVDAVLSASSPAEFSFLQKDPPPGGWVELFRRIGLIRSPAFPASQKAWESEFSEVEPKKWVAKISPRPLAIMHGECDELIPTEHARELFSRAGEPKDFILVPAGAHRLRVDERALDLAAQWLVDWKQSKKTGRPNDRT